MASAHKRNQRAATRASKTEARRTQRRQAADQRRARRVMDQRHRRRIGTGSPGKSKKPTASVERKRAQAAKRAARRRRAALIAATGIASAHLIRGGRRTGVGIRDAFNDARTHLLGSAALLEGLEKARLFNDEHGIRDIPDIPDTLVHTRTRLASTGPTMEGTMNTNPFDLRPESEDLLNKIQMAVPEGMMGVVGAFDHAGKAVQAQSDAWIILAQKAAAEMPLHPEVAKQLESVHKAFRVAVQAAEELGPLTRRLHADDIARHENPRVNEQAWDVSAQ